jgi:hypothetical protein
LKKRFPIFLLFLALSSQLGTFVVYLIQQEINKESIIAQIAQNIPKEKLIKIQSDNQLKWKEESKEFSLNGIYYDIVSSENINGILWYYCISDAMETKLINQYASETKHISDATPIKKDSKHQIKYPSRVFIVTNSAISMLHLAKSKCIKDQFNLHLITISYEILIPPPRLA